MSLNRLWLARSCDSVNRRKYLEKHLETDNQNIVDSYDIVLNKPNYYNKQNIEEIQFLKPLSVVHEKSTKLQDPNICSDGSNQSNSHKTHRINFANPTNHSPTSSPRRLSPVKIDKNIPKSNRSMNLEVIDKNEPIISTLPDIYKKSRFVNVNRNSDALINLNPNQMTTSLHQNSGNSTLYENNKNNPILDSINSNELLANKKEFSTAKSCNVDRNDKNFDRDKLTNFFYKTTNNIYSSGISNKHNSSPISNKFMKDSAWKLILKYNDYEQNQREVNERREREQRNRDQYQITDRQLEFRKQQQIEEYQQKLKEKEEVRKNYRKFIEDEKAKRESLRHQSIRLQEDRLNQIRQKEKILYDEKEFKISLENQLIANNKLQDELEKKMEIEKKQKYKEGIKQCQVDRSDRSKRETMTKEESSTYSNFINSFDEDSRERKKKFLKNYHNDYSPARRQLEDINGERLNRLLNEDRLTQAQRDQINMIEDEEKMKTAERKKMIENDIRHCQEEQIQEYNLSKITYKMNEKDYIDKLIKEQRFLEEEYNKKESDKKLRNIEDMKYLVNQTATKNERDRNQYEISINELKINKPILESATKVFNTSDFQH